jgi:pilus assembly protein CpaE
MTDETICIKLEIRNRNLRREFESIIRSIPGFDIQRPGDVHRIDLWIFELSDEHDKDFQHVQNILNSGEVKELFLTSTYSDQTLLKRAMQTGAREFFDQSVKEEEIRQALEKFKERRERLKNETPGKKGQIINVLGSKGGVGTTTIAVNLAVCLAELERVPSVALIDMNLVFGEIPLFLDIEPTYNWSEITKNISRLDATFLKNILSVDPSGVYVLCSPGYLSGYNVAPPAIIESLLKVMQRMFDFVIIDGGHSMGNISLKLLEMSDTALIVSNLSIPCLANTNKLLKSFYDLGYPERERINIVINRYLKNSNISIEDAEKSFDKKIFWTIPNDYNTTVSAINKGKPLTQFASKEPITENFRQMASSICPSREEKEEKKKRKFWKFLSR